MAALPTPTINKNVSIEDLSPVNAQNYPRLKVVDLTIAVNATYSAADTIDLTRYCANLIVASFADAMDTTGACLAYFTPGTAGSPVGCKVILRRQVSGAFTTFEDAGTQGNGLSVHVVLIGY